MSCVGTLKCPDDEQINGANEKRAPIVEHAAGLNVLDYTQLCQAVDELAGDCKVMALAKDTTPVPEWRVRDANYMGLARIIAFQQISVSAATAIWGRVEGLLGDISPAGVLRTDEDDLRGCGLSRPKIRHLKSIASAVEDGALNLTRVAEANDEDARTELVSVKGIGPWTADVYLMFALGRTDLFPHADVGLLEAYRMLREDEDRLTPQAFLETAEKWRPYRSVAAHMLWAHINYVRARQTGGA